MDRTVRTVLRFGGVWRIAVTGLMAGVPILSVNAACPGATSDRIGCDWKISRPVDPNAIMLQFPGVQPAGEGTLNLMVSIPAPAPLSSITYNSQSASLDFGFERLNLGFGAGNIAVGFFLHKPGSSWLHYMASDGRLLRFDLVDGRFMSSDFERGDLTIVTVADGAVVAEDPRSGSKITCAHTHTGQWGDLTMFFPTSLIDRSGDETTVTYEGALMRELKHKATGKMLTFEANSDGNIEKIIDQDGVAMTYEYKKNPGGAFDLVAVNTPDIYQPLVFSAEYAGDSLMTRYQLAGSAQKFDVTYYNPRGLVKEVAMLIGGRGDVVDHITTYQSTSSKVTVVSETGEGQEKGARFTETTYTGPYPSGFSEGDGYPTSDIPVEVGRAGLAEQGIMTTWSDWMGRESVARYAPMSGSTCEPSLTVETPFPVCQRNSDGITTVYQRLANGAPTAIRLLAPDGKEVARSSFSWDPKGLDLLSTSITDGAGTVRSKTATAYNERGLPTRQTFEERYSFEYDKNSPYLVTKYTGPDGVTVTNSYDRGVVVSTTAAGVTQEVSQQVSEVGVRLGAKSPGALSDVFRSLDGKSFTESLVARPSDGSPISSASYSARADASINASGGEIKQSASSVVLQKNPRGSGAISKKSEQVDKPRTAEGLPRQQEKTNWRDLPVVQGGN